MNWKHLVNKTNASAFAWPEGWDTREEVAEQLDCSPDRVREVLAPAIRAGAVEIKDFKVWEDGRFVRKTGFRAAASAPQAAPRAKVELLPGVRVQTRRGGNSGVVTEADADNFTVAWADGSSKSYRRSAWEKRDIRPA
jgi:hypothetical protein